MLTTNKLKRSDLSAIAKAARCRVKDVYQVYEWGDKWYSQPIFGPQNFLEGNSWYDVIDKNTLKKIGAKGSVFIVELSVAIENGEAESAYKNEELYVFFGKEKI